MSVTFLNAVGYYPPTILSVPFYIVVCPASSPFDVKGQERVTFFCWLFVNPILKKFLTRLTNFN